MLTRPRSITRFILAVFILLAVGGSAIAQETKSAAVAKELAAALDAAKLTAIAAKDPSDPEAFVAAMYFSGSQLLVVGAKYSPAVLLNQKLANKDYQEIYIDLNSAAVAGSKVFIEDPGRRRDQGRSQGQRGLRHASSAAASGRISTTTGARTRSSPTSSTPRSWPTPTRSTRGCCRRCWRRPRSRFGHSSSGPSLDAAASPPDPLIRQCVHVPSSQCSSAVEIRRQRRLERQP